LQRSAAEIFRQSVDAEFHAYFELSYTDSSNIEMQGTIYVEVLVINLYYLNSSAKATQYQRVDVAVSSFGQGPKRKHFDVQQYNNTVIAEYNAYEKVYELTSGAKDTKISAHEVSILLQHLFDYLAKCTFLQNI
jgi:hypothetical protein